MFLLHSEYFEGNYEVEENEFSTQKMLVDCDQNLVQFANNVSDHVLSNISKNRINKNGQKIKYGNKGFRLETFEQWTMSSGKE